MLNIDENDLEKLAEPTRSEVGRLCGAISCIIGGKTAEAVIKMQAFIANWRVDHPDMPIFPRPDYKAMNDDRKPTDKQVEYSVKVAMFTGVRLPEKFTRSEYSKYLDENGPRLGKILADAREQGENAEPVLTMDEVVEVIKNNSSGKCDIGSGSSGCKRCQEHQRQYAEKHKDDPEGTYPDDVEPF